MAGQQGIGGITGFPPRPNGTPEDVMFRNVKPSSNDVMGPLNSAESSLRSAIAKESGQTSAMKTNDASRTGMNTMTEFGKLFNNAQVQNIQNLDRFLAPLYKSGDIGLPGDEKSEIPGTKVSRILSNDSSKPASAANEILYLSCYVDVTGYGQLGRTEEHLKRAIGLMCHTWHYIKKINQRTLTSTESIYGIRRMIANLKNLSQYHKGVASFPKPGTKEFLHIFQHLYRRGGVVQTVKRANDGISEGMLCERIRKGPVQIYGIWGSEFQEPNVLRIAGYRLVCRHPGREEEEMRAQNKGKYFALSFTRAEEEERYMRLEPVLLDGNGKLEHAQYNGSNWEGMYWPECSIRQTPGYLYNEIYSLIQVYLYNTDDAVATTAMANLPVIEVHQDVW